MRLVHWSADIVTEVHGRHQINILDRNNGKHSLPGKPKGFWLSDESRGVHGWRTWCKSERFMLYSLRYKHEVKLSPKAKILYLRSVEDIDEFSLKYGYSLLDKLDEQCGKVPFSVRHGYTEPHYDGIDWKRVAKKYHGIIITPYQWERRLDMLAGWYYTWDCASGCIWNARAIESIEVVREYKAPHKPTYWQQRRAHKRQMIRLAQASKDMVAAMQKEREPSALDNALVDSADKLIESYKGRRA